MQEKNALPENPSILEEDAGVCMGRVDLAFCETDSDDYDIGQCNFSS